LARAALPRLAKAEAGAPIARLPEFRQQRIGIAAQQVQRFGAVRRQGDVHVFTVSGEFKAQTAKLFGVERQLDSIGRGVMDGLDDLGRERRRQGRRISGFDRGAIGLQGKRSGQGQIGRADVGAGGVRISRGRAEEDG